MKILRGSIYGQSKIIFYFFHKIICCDPSLEQPWNSSSNKESQYMLSLQNMKFFPGLFLTAPYLYIIIILSMLQSGAGTVGKYMYIYNR